MVFYSYILLYYLRRLKQDILLCVLFVARVCSNRVSDKMVASLSSADYILHTNWTQINPDRTLDAQLHSM